MQVINFDIWGIFIALMSFLSTCSAEPKKVEYFAPETQGESRINYESIDTKLTLILLNDEKVFAYQGHDVSKGEFLAKTDIKKQIETANEKFSAPSFVVLIKPTKKIRYKTTVDILDEMAINKIDNYALEEPNAAEKQYLKIDN